MSKKTWGNTKVFDSVLREKKMKQIILAYGQKTYCYNDAL